MSNQIKSENKQVKKYLIVDDEPINRMILAGMLEDLDCEVFEACSALEGLKILKSEKIDAIMCDWMMPKHSGLDLLKWVRLDENLKDIPFLMQSALDCDQSINLAKLAGANGYLVKPYCMDEIMNKLSLVCVGSNEFLAPKKSFSMRF